MNECSSYIAQTSLFRMCSSYSKRNASRSNTQCLDRYDTAEPPSGNIQKTVRVQSTDWKDSLPAFSALQKVGFVTAVGCVCCLPVRGEDCILRLHVCTVRLALAAKALGEPLAAKHIRAFMRTGQVDKRVDTQVIVECETLAEQWVSFDRLDYGTSESRAKFASRLQAVSKKKNAATLPMQNLSSEVARHFTWGVPCAKDSIDEEALEEFLRKTGGNYRAGAHYGLCWTPIHNQRLSYQFTFLDSINGCNPARTSFVVDMFVPGPSHILGANDRTTEALQKLLSCRSKALDTSPHPLDVLLEEAASDERMIVLPKSLCVRSSVTSA